MEKRRGLGMYEIERKKELNKRERKEREMYREREREENRANKRKWKIIDQEHNADDGYSKKRKYKCSLEERKRRQREKEDDLADKLKEEEEIAEGKMRDEETRKRQKQQDKETIELSVHSEEMPEAEEDRNRRSHERSSHRGRKYIHSPREGSRKDTADRDKDRERGSQKVKTPEKQKLSDARQSSDAIPETKDELFSYKINWDVFDEWFNLAWQQLFDYLSQYEYVALHESGMEIIFYSAVQRCLDLGYVVVSFVVKKQECPILYFKHLYSIKLYSCSSITGVVC